MTDAHPSMEGNFREHFRNLHRTTPRTRLSRAREQLRRVLGHRGVEIASVGLLGTLFTAEAKGAPLSPALVTRVVETATGGGPGAALHVLELAGKGSGTLSLTSFTVLMGSLAQELPAQYNLQVV